MYQSAQGRNKLITKVGLSVSSVAVRPGPRPPSADQHLRQGRGSDLSNVPVEALDRDPGVDVEDGEAEEDQAEVFELHVGEIFAGILLHILQNLVKVSRTILRSFQPIFHHRVRGEILDGGLKLDVLRPDQEEEEGDEEGDVEEVEEEPGEEEAPAAGLG